MVGVADATLLVISFALVFYHVSCFVQARHASKPMPPSPKGLPVVGNLLDVGVPFVPIFQQNRAYYCSVWRLDPRRPILA